MRRKSMAQETQEKGLEFAETFIGECITGDCDRPATVRVWEDFILCALHHTMHEVGEDQDEAGIGLELLAGWLSVATMHGNGYLQGLLGYAKDELLERKEWADRRMDQLQQDALSNAVAAVLAEEWPADERKAETLEVLKEQRDKANAEFARFREEVGIPGL
jgi:hypothetical protein